jgi:methyl-accepting chemotaxis protein
MASVPKLSISAKLYAIFVLLALASTALAAVTVINASRHAAHTRQLEHAFVGTRNVERVNGLIYAVVMESRGIYMSPDIPTAKKFALGLLKFNDQIGGVVTEWQRTVDAEEAAQFAEFAKRIDQFQEFRRELVRRGTTISPAAGREWGDNDANRNVRSALNKDLENLARLYDARAKRIYASLESDMWVSTAVVAALGILAVILVGLGVVIIWRAVARPLKRITRVTEQVAAGADAVVPYGARHDEIGALSRSITVFQSAMRRNEELNRTIAADVDARARHQSRMTADIAAFGAEVETTLSELGRIADQMVSASASLATAAERASTRTTNAAAASSEASSNVRDIASAAEELSASVMEIDRQVAQSNTIAERAVSEAEQTGGEIKGLDVAARRIGDVVRLITEIAEQTNLLALNATIEAARAGVAGRGFAVVASEVKALAGQTAKATEEISVQISGIQQATVRSVEAIDAIQSTIREVGGVSATIAAAVTEQGTATREIARSAEIAAKRTAEAAGAVNDLSDDTARTRGDATTVKSVAEDLGAVAGRLRGQVDGFFNKLRTA